MDTGILIPLVALVLLGSIVVLAGLYARRKGYLVSRRSKLILIVIVLLIAFLVWLGPYFIAP